VHPTVLTSNSGSLVVGLFLAFVANPSDIGGTSKSTCSPPSPTSIKSVMPIYQYLSLFYIPFQKLVKDFFGGLKDYCVREATTNFKSRRNQDQDRVRAPVRGRREMPDEIINQVWRVKIQDQSGTSGSKVGLDNEDEWVCVDSLNGKVFRIDKALRHLCALMDYVS